MGGGGWSDGVGLMDPDDTFGTWNPQIVTRIAVHP